jgi:hypothetical protein
MHAFVLFWHELKNSPGRNWALAFTATLENPFLLPHYCRIDDVFFL